MKARLKIYNNYIGNDIPDNSEQVEIVFQSSTGGGGSAGTLNTANTAAQTAVASEPLSGEVSLHKVSKTGSYTDLNNKPTIPVAQVNSDWNAASGVAQILNKPTIPAAQVNSDWDAVRGVAQILNKPTIPDAPGVLHTVSTRALEEQKGEPLSGEVSLHKVSKTGSYTDLNNKPTIPTAQVNSDWNAASGVAQILNKPTIPAAQVNSDWSATSGLAQILNKPTIPAAPGALNTNNTAAQTTQTSEALSGAINLHKVSKTGSYTDLNNKPTIPTAQVNSDWNAASGVAQILNKPTIPAAQVNSNWNATSGLAQILNKPTIPAAPGTLNTNNTAAQTAVASEALSGAINLHKVSKTGSYADLNNKPTIPAAQVNSDWNAASGVAQILNKPTIPAAQVNSNWNATSGLAQILNKPTIPAAPGALNTNNTAAQTTQTSEVLSGAINLHKVSKTGSYTDLNNKPTIPTAQVNSDWNATSGLAQILNKPTIPAAPGTLNTNNTAAQTVVASEALSGAINLHKVAKTGSYNDLNDKPTGGITPGSWVDCKTGISTVDLTMEVKTYLAKHLDSCTLLILMLEIRPDTTTWTRTLSVGTLFDFGAAVEGIVVASAGGRLFRINGANGSLTITLIIGTTITGKGEADILTATVAFPYYIARGITGI